jgi:hypothetical protein
MSVKFGCIMSTIDVLKGLKGRELVIDYKTNGSQTTYAKGVLVDIDEVSGKIVVSTLEKLWMIDIDSILNFRAKLKSDEEAEEEL